MRGTVLVVEDDPCQRRLYRLLLEDAGYRVEVATQGAQALEMLSKDPVDLVLLDLHLPTMDGRECATRLRASGFRTPVVLMSSDWEVQAVAAEVRAAAVLPKPFTAQELLATVQSYDVVA
jgi:two-component system response regulator MprA